MEKNRRDGRLDIRILVKFQTDHTVWGKGAIIGFEEAQTF